MDLLWRGPRLIVVEEKKVSELSACSAIRNEDRRRWRGRETGVIKTFVRRLRRIIGLGKQEWQSSAGGFLFPTRFFSRLDRAELLVELTVEAAYPLLPFFSPSFFFQALDANFREINRDTSGGVVYQPRDTRAKSIRGEHTSMGTRYIYFNEREKAPKKRKRGLFIFNYKSPLFWHISAKSNKN